MADITSPLRQRSLSLTDPSVQPTQLTPEEQAAIPTGSLQRGLVSATTGLAASDYARRALAEESAGGSASSALRARAGELARLSEIEAPPIRSYTQIDGAGSAFDYAAGAVGSMVPYVPVVAGGAMAARFLGPRGLRNVMPALGGSAAMYPIEKGQAALDQYMDPAQAAQPVEDREAVATTRAALNAGLMGAMGSSALRGVMGRAKNSVLGGAVEGALPMAGAHLVNTEAQNYLNPERDKSHDTTGLIDAVLQGGALGGAAHIPSAASQATAAMANNASAKLSRTLARSADTVKDTTDRVAQAAEPVVEGLTGALSNAASAVQERVVEPTARMASETYSTRAPQAAEFAKDATSFAEEKLNKFADSVRESRDFPDFMQHVFGNKDIEEARDLAMGDKAEKYKGADGKVDEAKLFADDAPRTEKTARYADDLLSNENVSEEVKAKVRGFNGDYSTPEAQSYIGNTILGQRAGERASAAIKAIKKGTEELLKKTKEAVIDTTENAKDAIIKKSKMEPKTRLDIEDLIYKGLKNELQAQPGTIKQVPELARTLTKLLAQGAEADDASLKAFGGFRALDDLFTDPAATVEQIAKTLGTDNLFKRSAKFESAYEDAKKADSMLYKALPPERREVFTATQLKELGRFIDSVSQLNDQQYKMAVEGLGREVFGSQETAKAVFNYYERRNKSEMNVEDVKRFNAKLAEEEAFNAKNSKEGDQGVFERAPEQHYVYDSVKEDDKRPFHSNELYKLASKLEAERGTGRDSIMNMLEYVDREGLDSVAELTRIEGDIKKRIEATLKDKEYLGGTPTQREYKAANLKRLREQLKGIEKRRKETQEELDYDNQSPEDKYGIDTLAAENALRDFHVGRIEADAPDKMKADDKFMRAARYGYSKMTQANREANKAQFVEFETKTTDFEGNEEVKTIRLHAPSMIREMGKRSENVEGEGPQQRNARLLKEAIVSVRSRPDVVAFKSRLRDVDMGDGITVRDAESEARRVTKEGMEADRFLNEDAPAKQQEIWDRERNVEKGYREAVAKYRAAVANNANPSRVQWLHDQAQAWKENYAEAMKLNEKEKAELDRQIQSAKDAGGKAEFEVSDKRERETQGVTDIIEDIINKGPDAGSRVNAERGQKTGDDSRETSQGVYTSEFNRDEKPNFRKRPNTRTVIKLYDKEGNEIFRGNAEQAAEFKKAQKEEQAQKKSTSGIERKSAEKPSFDRDITPEEAQAVRDYVLKTRGPDVEVLTDKFAKDLGGTGSYFKNGARRVIEIARDALNPMSTAYHESMHDFFHTLITSDAKNAQLKERLLRAADLPQVGAKLRILLKNHPEALKQVINEPEERLSYMYQFWASGHLKLSPDGNNIFTKITKFIRDVLGVVTRGEQAEAVLQAFHSGRLADPSTAGAIIADLNKNTLGDKIDNLTAPIRGITDRVFSPATDRLRDSGSAALTELADLFHKEPDRESGGLGFIQRRYQQQGKFANKLQDALAATTAEDRAKTLMELQSMQAPTTEAGRKIRALLDEMHDYMVSADVRNLVLPKDGSKGTWVPIGKQADYFPRVWDRVALRNNKEAFLKLLQEEGSMDVADAEATYNAMISGDGMIDLSENDRHVGFTPYSSAVKNRGLTFINKNNAAKFAEYQNKDLVNVMHTYIYQAAHRGEYARFFGNDGEVIQQALLRAKSEISDQKKVDEAAKAVRAMEGTLGAEINPRLRDLYSGVVGYENIVLLPFALFSSLIDPLGVAVRTGKIADAGTAFKDGIKGLFQDAFRSKKDAEYEMARTIGIIDNLNQLEAMGQLVGSQYMSRHMRKFNETFFKLNGMQTWNERMRVSAMGAGMRFVVRNKENTRYMQELGLESGDIKELSDGRIARTQEEGLSAEQEQRVQQALFRFVDDAVLRPNAAHRPVWSSDPHFMLIAHLKQYTFTFQQTILKQVKKEFLNGNTAPLWILASYVPFMAASDLLRGSLTGTIKNSWTVADFFADGIARSGILGTGSFVTDAMKDASMGNFPGVSMLGPAAQHAGMAAKAAMGANGIDWGDVLMRSLPASPLTKAVL